MSKAKKRLTKRQRKALSNGRPVFLANGDRVVPMTPEIDEVLRDQLARFREKFGREAGPGDPVFFDENSDEPRPISEEEVERNFDEAIGVLLRQGVDAEICFAAWRTRRFVTEQNKQNLLDEEIVEWNEAYEEYRTGRSEDARVFRVLMVEGARVVEPKDVDKLIELASELGVKDVVMKRIRETVSN